MSPSRKRKRMMDLIEPGHRTGTEGPQVPVLQDREKVIVIPAEQSDESTKRNLQPSSLVKFFAESALAKVELDLRRDPDVGRDIDL